MAVREKQISPAEAAGMVEDGSLLGFTTPVLDSGPMAFLRELVRRRKKNLRLATLTGGGLNVDFLIGAGVVAEYETCHCSLGELGAAPNFQRALRAQAFKMKDTT